MADVFTPGPARSGPSALDIGRAMGRGDVLLGIGIMTVILILFMPLATWLLDLCLALSITSSVLILMTSLFIKKPLEFSIFPTILLITTLFRLALNISSTRAILSHGHMGEDAAGEIIAAFGAFMMGGNFVIGVIVFSILVLINFVVITKGSGRIAEVAARFTLDAMPGKQMAIDADLSSGLITEDQARTRRRELEQESNFFGSMDGASKFVRGDAIAGLLITIINIIGGLVIGMLQHDMALGDAANRYTQLTVGDGLVSQIPALITSIAAGLLVSKSGVDTSADVALSAQLTANPQGLALVSGASGLMALLPGMPMLPFLAIAGAAGYGAWRISQTARKAAAAPVIDPVVTEPQEEPIQTALAIDELKIELGFGLLGLINELDGRKLTDQIKALRRQLAGDLGVVLPPVRIIDNLALGSEEYVVRVKEMEAGRGRLKLHHLLTMDPAGGAVRLPGERVKEPAFGLPATWIEESLREEAMLNGYTVVDPAAVMTTHLTEIIKDNLGEFMSFATVQRLIKDLPKEHQKLVEDITPGQITQAGIQRVLQNLLREQVSIRDLPTILEAIAEAAQPGSDILQITEYVRARLARQLCHAYRGSDGALPVVTLSPAWEQEFQDALIGERDKTLALAPSKLHAFVADVRDGFDRAAQGGETPVLLTSPVIRPYVRSLIERFRPQTVVMSQNEVHPKARLKSYGSV